MFLRGRDVTNIILISVALLLVKEIRFYLLRGGYETRLFLEYPKESYVNFTTRSTIDGYSAEEHTVATDDGYLLTIYHMHGSKKCSGPMKYPPIVMMHGFLMSSDTWLDAGPDAGLAYLLADACFDLWLGNVRGNYYGRRHIELDPDNDPEFWDFSADEMGLHDVPATIDYVLQQTGADSVNYIGFSQGAGLFLIMCSERPEHCVKARSFLALAPATRLRHSRSALLRLTISQLRAMESVLNTIGIKEVLSQGGFGQELLASFCKYKMFAKTLCKRGLVILDSHHAGSIKLKTYKVLYSHFPSGTSVRAFARYGQALYSEGYRKYDYGESKNLEAYGAAAAPFYNLSAVRVPTFIVHGNNDYLVDPEDLKWLARSLPNVLERVEVADPMWNHVDFMYSQHIKTLVLPKILECLSKYSEVK